MSSSTAVNIPSAPVTLDGWLEMGIAQFKAGFHGPNAVEASIPLLFRECLTVLRSECFPEWAREDLAAHAEAGTLTLAVWTDIMAEARIDMDVVTEVLERDGDIELIPLEEAERILDEAWGNTKSV